MNFYVILYFSVPEFQVVYFFNHFYLSARISYLFIDCELIFLYILEHNYNHCFKDLHCEFQYLDHLSVSPLIAFSLEYGLHSLSS